MYAIIETGGKQYKVSEGDTVRVEKLGQDAGSTYTFDKVLSIGGNGENKFGTPIVTGASVSAEVLGDIKDKKLVVFKMKRRKGYRRKNGHRQNLTEVKITGITA